MPLEAFWKPRVGFWLAAATLHLWGSKSPSFWPSALPRRSSPGQGHWPLAADGASGCAGSSQVSSGANPTAARGCLRNTSFLFKCLRLGGTRPVVQPFAHCLRGWGSAAFPQGPRYPRSAAGWPLRALRRRGSGPAWAGSRHLKAGAGQTAGFGSTGCLRGRFAKASAAPQCSACQRGHFVTKLHLDSCHRDWQRPRRTSVFGAGRSGLVAGLKATARRALSVVPRSCVPWQSDLGTTWWGP